MSRYGKPGGVLDLAHRLTLRAVDEGQGEDTPAMQSLPATGLVGRSDDGGYVVTPAGKAALEASRSGRRERISWTLLVVCGGILAIAVVIDRLT